MLWKIIPNLSLGAQKEKARSPYLGVTNKFMVDDSKLVDDL